jgi:hypothetical protein
MNPEVICYNCDCKGYYKADCWQKGEEKRVKVLTKGTEEQGTHRNTL